MLSFSLLCFAAVSSVASGASLGASSNASAAQTTVHTVFESQKFNDTKLRYVKDSGVCETTPGVGQISGYVDVGQNMSMWFWFFEARNAAETAPFTLWINGGPGCASEIGLFQENGPCMVNADGKTTTLNPFSWNTVSNMIYIDQPIGTGFSYGTDTVNSTNAAAPAVWLAFQLLFESKEFSKFQNREFVFASESYGGHYMPSFITYFNQQNQLIKAHKLKAEPIVVAATLVNDGWFDPLIANKAYVDFATNAPGYGPLQNDSVIAALHKSFYEPNGCRDQQLACYASGTGPHSNKVCGDADDFCIDKILVPAVGDRDIDDLRQPAPGAFPPEFYIDFLAQPEIMAKIGALSPYSECPDSVFELFTKTGDDARTFLPQLSKLADSGLKMLLWAGDADINCNWLGVHATALAMNWHGKAKLAKAPMQNMTINGKVVGTYQNVDNFSFALVHGAGHEVPAFQPEMALEIFKQVIKKQPIHSV